MYDQLFPLMYHFVCTNDWHVGFQNHSWNSGNVGQLEHMVNHAVKLEIPSSYVCVCVCACVCVCLSPVVRPLKADIVILDSLAGS